MTPLEEVEKDLGEFYQRMVTRKLAETPTPVKEFIPQVEVQKLGMITSKKEEPRGKLSLPDEQTLGPPFPSLFDVSPRIISTAGNGTITVTGADFLSGATVFIDNIGCPTQFLNSSLLSATTPAHGVGFVDVQVINPTGQASNVLIGVLQYANAPSFASITPDNGTHDGGTSVTIAGSGFESGVTVRFDNISATSIVLVNSNTITCVTPAHADGVVSVSITNHPSNFTTSGSYTYGGATPGAVSSYKFLVADAQGNPVWQGSGSTFGIRPGPTYPFSFGAFDASDNFLSTYNGYIQWIQVSQMGGFIFIDGSSPVVTIHFTNGLSSDTIFGYLLNPPNTATGSLTYQGDTGVPFSHNWIMNNNQQPPP